MTASEIDANFFLRAGVLFSLTFALNIELIYRFKDYKRLKL